MSEAELEAIIKRTVAETLREMGIRPADVKPWLSQNKASKLVGRKRLERAMREGRVEFRKLNPGMRNSRVNVSVRDVMKLIKQPEI